MSIYISKNRIRATGADANALFKAITEPKPPKAPDDMRVKVREFTGNGDVIPLHAIDQGLVTDMQKCIRFQRAQLDKCADALHYVLNRISREPDLRNKMGAATETFERLTAALADAKDRDVDALRDHYIPGSAAIHLEGDEE